MLSVADIWRGLVSLPRALDGSGRGALLRELGTLKQQLADERTKNQKLEMRLAENENRLRLIIESEPELVMLQDARAVVVEMNPAGLVVLEADEPEVIIGHDMSRVVAPEFLETYRLACGAVFKGTPRTFEVRIVGLKGTVRWLELHAFPLRDGHNRVAALIGIGRDVTQQVQAREEASRHQTELARVMRMNTIGEMASGVAHEISQPLSAISNFADGCLRRIRCGGADGGDLIAALEQIQRQAQRAGYIIRHIKKFVRRHEPYWTTVDVNEVVQDVWTLLEPEARQKAISSVLTLDDTLPDIKGDQIELEQVVVNLVRNAIEAMSDVAIRNRKLKIETRRFPSHIEVSVTDSGVGVPSDISDKIFGPFFTTKNNGLGMGLSISRTIVESHGGKLWHSQGSGGGATFAFRLPIGQG
ncbi:MAG: sensor histidine kinase [Pseudomonadota bacterium]